METHLPKARKYKTMEARWNATIRKWTRMIVILKAGKVPENVDDSSCAMCAEYIDNIECEGCPIAEGGHDKCRLTPYSDFSDSDEAYQEANWDQFSDEPELRHDMLKHARLELKYLKQVRKAGFNGG